MYIKQSKRLFSTSSPLKGTLDVFKGFHVDESSISQTNFKQQLKNAHDLWNE